MSGKRGRNFKEVIAEEKKKRQNRRKIMRILTGINSDAIYGGSFLAIFIPVAFLIYGLLAPSTFVWAGILIVVAVTSSLFANHVTKSLKRKQWKYASK